MLKTPNLDIWKLHKNHINKREECLHIRLCVYSITTNDVLEITYFSQLAKKKCYSENVFPKSMTAPLSQTQLNLEKTRTSYCKLYYLTQSNTIYECQELI